MTARPRRIVRSQGAVALLLALACGDGGTGSAPAQAAKQDAAAGACGALDQACCAAPRFACARGLGCDDAGVCREGGDGSLGASFLCQTDDDCAPRRRCCRAGNYGTCQALEPGLGCAQPDLGVLVSGAGISAEAALFDGLAPSDGGCVREPGVRVRLRISVAVANFGAADFILGERDAPRSGAAAGRDEFLQYSLLDASGEALATSGGPLPCSAANPALERFDCDFAGLAAGALMPARGLECEALDVTGLPAGHYRVRVSLAHPWGDADPSNDRVEVPVELPSFDPLAACPSVENVLLSSSAYRECGWSRVPAPRGGRCVPGAPIWIDCVACQGAPILRLCPGDAACMTVAALGVASSFGPDPSADAATPCNVVQGHCPPSGTYNVLLGSEDPAAEASCTLAISPGF
jgi:hypothetical protein